MRKSIPLASFVATSCTAATKSSRQPGRCPSYSGPAAGATHSAIRTYRLQLVQRSAGNQQGSLGNSKRFISTFVAGILLIVLVNVDQLVVIWLQNEHTQKTLSPHLLLTSPVKRRSQRNAICSAYLRHCLDTWCTFHQEVAYIELQKTDMQK
ncbi:hypothetical protein ACSZNF_02345 [Aeromonas hydrophila]